MLCELSAFPLLHFLTLNHQFRIINIALKIVYLTRKLKSSEYIYRHYIESVFTMIYFSLNLLYKFHF